MSFKLIKTSSPFLLIPWIGIGRNGLLSYKKINCCSFIKKIYRCVEEVLLNMIISYRWINIINVIGSENI